MKLDHSVLTVTVSEIVIQRYLSSSLLIKTGLLFPYKIFLDIKKLCGRAQKWAWIYLIALCTLYLNCSAEV